MRLRRFCSVVGGATLLALLGCFSASAAAPAIGLNFTGITSEDELAWGLSIAPPDSNGTVGPDHYAEFVNGGFAVYDKRTGDLAGPKISDRQFWTNAGFDPGFGNLSDPRLIFDRATGRWFAAQITIEIARNNILLARSEGSDPAGGWKMVKFTGNSGFADFPMLGVDADGVYVATNNFMGRIFPTLTGVSVFSIPKADIVQEAPSIARMSAFEDLPDEARGFSIQPVNYFGPSKGHGSLIAVDATQLGKIDRTNIIGSSGAGAVLSDTVVITAQDESPPPLAYQPDGTRIIDTGGDNYNSSVYQVGHAIWAAHGTDVNGRAAVRWTVLDERTSAILQEGTIASSEYDFIYPSIAANEFGEVVIAFTRSGKGADGYLSAFAVVGTTEAGVTTFGEPILLKAGEVNYHKFNTNPDGDPTPERWGDYSATNIDPDNPHVFWTIQEFALDSSILPKGTAWGTQITQIIVPEPGAWGAIVFVCVVLARRRGRR